MTLVRWEPFSEISNLQKQMNSLFDSLAHKTTVPWSSAFVPAVEMDETPEEIHLKLEIPGMDAKDIDIEVSPDSVYISGERKEETKTEEKGISRSEFRYGSFRRVIPLSAHVQNKNVKAEYKDGILRLNLPKAEEDKNNVVKVNIS